MLQSYVIPGVISLIVFAFQIYYFVKTANTICKLKHFFPDANDLKVKTCQIRQSIIGRDDFQKKIQNLNALCQESLTDDGSEILEVSLLFLDDKVRRSHELFAQSVDKTNQYLCRNVGVNADLNILKDIIDDELEVLENNIHNELNIPLSFGLAGTFIGIIYGVHGIDLQQLVNTNASLGSIDRLLHGVTISMMTSLVGLLLTIKNSSIELLFPSFKDASRDSDQLKNNYVNFLRRELMPILSHSMASSLESLKNVLGHFVQSFGSKLDDYSTTAELLNDNLDKQQQVLSTIQQMNLAKTSKAIAASFEKLKESSDALNIFYKYQQDLNLTMKNVIVSAKQVGSVAIDVDHLLSKFDLFISGLESVVQAVNNSADLQNQFRESLETHFPSGNEGRNMWRNEFDLLMKEAQDDSKLLSSQLTAQTQYIQKFVKENIQIFSTLGSQNSLLETFTNYVQLQINSYNDLKKEVVSLRSEYAASKSEYLELNKSTLDAVLMMDKLLEIIKKSNNGREIKN